MTYNTLLCLLFLIFISKSILVGSFNSQRLIQIRQSHDYTHHFVFFNLNMLTLTRPYLQRWNIADDIKFYYNECEQNKLPQCQNAQQFPILLVFNKVLIRYNGNPKDPKILSQWMEDKLSLLPKYITSKQQLQTHITTHNNLFCICFTEKARDDTSYFYTLAKTFPYVNFCIITKEEVFTQLGLKERNVTMFINSTDNRREYQYQNRYENWQMFVKINAFSRLGRADQLANLRFKQQNKNVQAVALVCEYSYRCQSFWREVATYEKQLNSTKDYLVKLAFLDQKQSYVFNLYYNFMYNTTELPALVYIDLVSTEGKAGKLKRYKQYLKQKEFNMQVLNNFVQKVKNNQISQYHLSADTPKNNGFYGKGGQKMIQKLTANSYTYEIQYAQKHYILLVTALNIGCDKCDQFYKQFKQMASLLIDKQITFGLLNVYQNQVQIQQMTSLPEVLLYLKDNKKQPVRMEHTQSFDGLIAFIKDKLGKDFMEDQTL